MIYLDTSWLVKLYVDEGDANAVRRVVDADADVLVSDLAFVEFHAAVARRKRDGSLAARTATALVSRFQREWPERGRVVVTHEIVVRAADLVTRHPLRSLDALQLASALLIARGAPEPLRFGASAERLCAAARAEGLDTLSTG